MKPKSICQQPRCQADDVFNVDLGRQELRTQLAEFCRAATDDADSTDGLHLPVSS